MDIDKTPGNDWIKGFSVLTDSTAAAMSLKLSTPKKPLRNCGNKSLNHNFPSNVSLKGSYSQHTQWFGTKRENLLTDNTNYNNNRIIIIAE